MVRDFLAHWCGRAFADALPATSAHRFASPSPLAAPAALAWDPTAGAAWDAGAFAAPGMFDP